METKPRMVMAMYVLGAGTLLHQALAVAAVFAR